MPKLFLSLEWVEEANIDEKVTLEGATLTTIVDNKAYAVEEAVRFVKVEGGDPDAHQLLGKVKTNAALEAMNAEVERDSVLVNEDTAYQVQPGYVAVYQGADSPISALFK